MPTSSTADAEQTTIAAQLGRPLRAPSEVVTRCPLGLPVVVAVPPLLGDGTPFPTRFWLTCPLATKRIARLESAGGVKAMDTKAKADAAFGQALSDAHERYARERDRLLPPVLPERGPRPRGGVGGALRGVKCLHAHYADHAAGNDNPVGVLVAPEVEPLDCTIPCVRDGALNPDWREPR